MKHLYILLLLAFTACSQNNDSSEGIDWIDAQFTAQFLNKTYQDEVRYFNDETEGFTVYSDNNDIEDTDGDGLIVALFQTGEKIQLDLVDNGVRYGGQITNWQQTGNEITGTGDMNKEGDIQNLNISFTLLLNE
mgnify:CR=1 FL=1